jgi:hypothetical protein
MGAPVFNLQAQLWEYRTGSGHLELGSPPSGPPRLTVACGLMGVSKGYDSDTTTNGVYSNRSAPSKLLLPARTDIRFLVYSNNWPDRYICDVVRVPHNREFWWYVLQWYDVKRGFAGEFRVGIIYPVPAWWSSPPHD